MMEEAVSGSNTNPAAILTIASLFTYSLEVGLTLAMNIT